MNFLNQIRKSKLSDIKLIDIDLTSECTKIDSECQLFRSLPFNLSSKIERRVSNRRKRKLFFYRESLRKKLVSRITMENSFIVDNMPLEVCKLSRSSHSWICKQDYQTSLDKGYCASQGSNYYGYKMHAVCSVDGVFTDFNLTQVSTHDSHYLRNIKPAASLIFAPLSLPIDREEYFSEADSHDIQ